MNKKEKKIIKKLIKSDFNNPKTYLVLTPDEKLPSREEQLKKYKRKEVNVDIKVDDFLRELIK